MAAVGLHVDVHGFAAHPLPLHPRACVPRRSRILRLIGSLPRRHAGQQDVMCAPRAVPAGQWTGEGIGGDLYIGWGAPASEGTSATLPMGNERSGVGVGGEIWAWSDRRLTHVMLYFLRRLSRPRGAGDEEESRARAAVGVRGLLSRTNEMHVYFDKGNFFNGFQEHYTTELIQNL